MMHESSMGGYNSRSPHALRKRAATLEDLHAISDSDRANDWGLGSARIRAKELKFSRDDIIARGHHGIVYKGCCRGSPVAIKLLRNQNLNRKELEALQREAEIMRSLRHPSILLLMGVCTERRNLAIVTEFVAGRDLGAIIRDRDVDMTVRQKLNIAKGIAQGMTWLHCLQPEPIIHRDLKPANVLVTKDGNVKVCDFGLSCVREKFDPSAPPKETVSGTALYLSPEVMEGVPSSEKSDVYAFAILLWELFTRAKPFTEYKSSMEVYEAVVGENKRPPLTSDVPDAVAALLEDCWQRDRLKRPSFGEILQRLDDIVVDTTIPDQTARAFWKELRPQDGMQYPWSVSWRRFMEAYHRYSKSNLPLPLYLHSAEGRCARLILAAATEDMTRSKRDKEYNVMLESFGRFVHLFGPFRRSILVDFEALCKRGCFHGLIEAKEAERRLGNKKKRKKFLLRMSARDPTCLTISRGHKGGFRHMRVQRTARGWNVPVGKDMHSFATLDEFLDSPLARKSGKKGLGLKRPCVRDSEFAAVHREGGDSDPYYDEVPSSFDDHDVDDDEYVGQLLAHSNGGVRR